MKYPLLRILILASPLLIAGCNTSNQGKSLLENYLYRMGNATDQDIDDKLSALPGVTAYPAKRSRLVEEKQIRKGLIDTLKLGHCNLLPLVANRNSSLGKVMPPSQRLVYELKFYHQLNHCLRHANFIDQPSLRNELRQLADQKWHNLGAILWNATYSSKAFENNFALNQPPLQPNNEGALSTSIEAIRYFSHLAETVSSRQGFTLPTKLDDIEQHYKALEHNQIGAQWITSMRMMTVSLNRVATAIKQRRERRKVCPLGKPTPAAKILKNVFTKYYAGQVQPYMSTIDKTGKKWIQHHEQLLDKLRYRNQLNNYQQQMLSFNSKLWKDYISARNRHTKQWQLLLRSCGLMPKK